MAEMNRYFSTLKQAMEMLAENPRTIFLGQTVGYPGSRFTYKSLENIAQEKRIELPIMEEAQMGISTGLALEGYIPVSIYPRVDFLLLAANQLVNHLDKFEELSRGEYKPKVIIRTIAGATKPYPGPQHCQDHTKSFESLLKNIDVVRLDNIGMIIPSYKKALESEKSTLLVDVGNYIV